jgi:hypothetical protein
MSGTDGLNPQGINHSKKVRSQFPLAWDDLILSGGDFSSFEVSLAAATYKDEKLDAALVATHWHRFPVDHKEVKKAKAKGVEVRTTDDPAFVEVAEATKMAALFGEIFFPDSTYDQVLESEGDVDDDKYDKAKRGMYAFFYGGNENTLEDRVGIVIDVAKQAIQMLMVEYPGIGRARKRIEDLFCAMRQPGGIGSKVVWNEPADFIESPLGFRRYFTLENQICKALFNLSNKPPEHWKDIKIKVVRRDRVQTVQGASQSALYGAAFQIQAANFRAAANHEIQCFGSQITKAVQCEVWKFQPSGIHKWHVMPMNVHDEIDAPCLPELQEPIKKAVLTKIETYRPMVPLIKMKWDCGMQSWKGKE